MSPIPKNRRTASSSTSTVKVPKSKAMAAAMANIGATGAPRGTVVRASATIATAAPRMTQPT